jgi:hypothetical protein
VSQPRYRVRVNGTTIPAVSVRYDEPDGGGGATCAIEFADPAFRLSTSDALEVSFGYAGRGGLDVVMATTGRDTAQVAIEPDGDRYTVTAKTLLDAKRNLAPASDDEVLEFAPPGSRAPGRLHALMQYVLVTKIGYDWFQTNLPNVPLPGEIRFTPEESYWDVLNRSLDPFRPLVAPYERGGQNGIYIWWMDVAVPGTGVTLPFKKSESIARPSRQHEIVNQAILKYFPRGDDGPNGRGWNCGARSTRYNDATGRLLRTTHQSCGNEHLEIQASISRTKTTELHQEGQGGQDEEPVHVKTHWFVLSDGREVKYRVEEIHHAKRSVLLEKVQTVTTDFYYLSGSNYEVTTGERVHREGYANLPLKGRSWVEDLEDIVTWSTWGQFEGAPDTWQLLYRERVCRGRALRPDNVPLQVGSHNGTVDSTTSSYQYTEYTKLWREVEQLTQVGESELKYTKTRYDYLKDHTSRSDSGAALGRQPRETDTPEPVEELYQDEASVAANGARKAVVIDGTWLGAEDDPYSADTELTGRVWCRIMADAMFRRSGTGDRQYTATIAKALTRVRRGGIALGSVRSTATPVVTARAPKRYVVTGVTFEGRTDPNTALVTVTTTVSAKAIEEGEE